MSEEMEELCKLLIEHKREADEAQYKKDCEIGGTWLPASNEFKKWRDQDYYQSLRESIVALALIYGYPVEEDK